MRYLFTNVCCSARHSSVPKEFSLTVIKPPAQAGGLALYEQHLCHCRRFVLAHVASSMAATPCCMTSVDYSADAVFRRCQGGNHGALHIVNKDLGLLNTTLR